MVLGGFDRSMSGVGCSTDGVATMLHDATLVKLWWRLRHGWAMLCWLDWFGWRKRLSSIFLEEVSGSASG